MLLSKTLCGLSNLKKQFKIVQKLKPGLIPGQKLKKYNV